jgi:hypothetical protein
MAVAIYLCGVVALVVVVAPVVNKTKTKMMRGSKAKSAHISDRLARRLQLTNRVIPPQPIDYLCAIHVTLSSQSRLAIPEKG